MKELSLNILDIAMNSVKAEATRIDIEIRETEDELEFSVSDNGYGMSEEMIRRVTDPFCTTRTTRKVGLGIPSGILYRRCVRSSRARPRSTLRLHTRARAFRSACRQPKCASCLARMSRCPRQRSLRGQPIICASNTTPCLHKFANRKRNTYRKGHQE